MITRKQMKSREFKYIRSQTIRRHQNSTPEMWIGKSGIEVRGGIKCGECGLSYPSKDMLRCVNDDDVEFLCNSCNDGTFYCQCCGRFSAGISSFEVSGICDNCRDQIEADNFDDEDPYGYEPNWEDYE